MSVTGDEDFVASAENTSSDCWPEAVEKQWERVGKDDLLQFFRRAISRESPLRLSLEFRAIGVEI